MKTEMNAAISSTSAKMGLLGSLYFSQGLPFGFFTQALPVLLRKFYSVCAAEHFAGGMATAALFTSMMDWCSREASGTDYTVQASAVVIATGIASALAGFSAQAFGYFGHFCLATALAVGAVAAVRRCFPTAEAVKSIRCDAKEVASCA